MVEHRIKKDIRHAGFTAGKRYLSLPRALDFPLDFPVQIRMVWSVPTKHRRDADSAQPTLKSYQDGLVDAGVLSGDHWEIVRKSYCEIEHTPNQPMSVRVEIEPAERKDTTT